MSESTIGFRLKEERKRLGLNQAEFGGFCGVHRMTQVKYENSERHFDSLYLQKMLTHTTADVLYILTGERGFTPKLQCTADEINLLKMWRRATDNTKNIALQVLKLGQ